MNRITVQGGRVIDPANQVDQIQDVHIADGKIVALGARPDGFTTDRMINAEGRWVIPGLVELSARPASLAAESRAAVASGVTTLCIPPSAKPCIDTPAEAELLYLRGRQSDAARVYVIGGLTQNLDGERLTEMGALAAAGCVALSNDRRPVTNTLVLRRALEYAASHGLTVLLYAKDPWLHQQGCAHEGPIASRLGLPAIPIAAETVGLGRDLALVELTKARVHFCRLSSGEAVEMIRAARDRGLPVSADVAIHHLCFCDEDLDGYDPNFHVDPPLRSSNDRDRLRRGVADGTLSAICSDHEPLGDDAKRAPFPQASPGISGVETLLSQTLALAKHNLMPLSTAIARVTCDPAAILGLELGHLAVSAAADLCVIDPDRQWSFSVGSQRSAGHNSPLIGRTMTGVVTHTLVGGHLVYQHEG